MIKKLIGAIVLIALSPAVSLANFNGLHKWVSPTGITYLYLPDQPPNAPTQSLRIQQMRTRLIKLNNCGIGKVSNTETTLIDGFFTESGQGIDQFMPDPGSPQQPVPTCRKNEATGLYESNWNPPVNSAMKISHDAEDWYLKLGTGIGAVNMKVVSRRTVTTNSNECGFVRLNAGQSPEVYLKATGSNDFTGISIAGLPTVPAPMICRKGVEYQPEL